MKLKFFTNKKSSVSQKSNILIRPVAEENHIRLALDQQQGDVAVANRPAQDQQQGNVAVANRPAQDQQQGNVAVVNRPAQDQ